MIKNEKQLKITKKAMLFFKKAIDKYDIDEVAKRIGSLVLAKAELKTLKIHYRELDKQIKEYENFLKL